MKYSILSLIIIILFANDTWAYTCQTYASSNNAIMTSSSITIPRSLAINSQIGIAKTGVVSTYTCVNSTPQLTYQTFGVRSNGQYVSTVDGKRIYSTNIKGIGYAVGASSVSGCSSSIYYVNGSNNIDGNQNNLAICAINGMFPTQPMTGTVQFIFYKIAKITGSGAVSLGSAGGASFILQNNQNAWQYPESNVILTSFTINTTPCDVNQTIISVPMGSVPKNQFNGPGTGPFDSNTKQFTIALTCNPDVKINVQIDGNIQNASLGILNLTPSDITAKGVGIQILFNNAPLTLGKPFNIGTSDIDGLYNINLTARYYQTGNISSGTADSTATFTINYD